MTEVGVDEVRVRPPVMAAVVKVARPETERLPAIVLVAVVLVRESDPPANAPLAMLRPRLLSRARSWLAVAVELARRPLTVSEFRAKGAEPSERRVVISGSVPTLMPR